MKNRLGFTLIELLIAISIISVLAGIGSFSYANIQQKSRDAKRKTGLTTIAGALEIYFAKFHHYPRKSIGNCKFSTGGYDFYGWCSSSDLPQNPWIPNLDDKYIKVLPRDPKASNGSSPPEAISPYISQIFNYAYHSCPAGESDEDKCGSDYFLMARLENPQDRDRTNNFTFIDVSKNPIDIDLSSNQPLYVLRSP